MVRLLVDVNNISHVLEYYDRIKIHRATSEGGSYSEITDVNTRLVLEAGKTKYYYNDSAGDSDKWYKTSYFKEDAGPESDLSAAIQGGTEVEKIGYTFGNYGPAPGEWGKAYTADDIRWTMLFGIDCVGSDTAQSEFTNEQFDQLVLESLAEFETLLTMDIRRKKYMTFESQSDTELTHARLWREGVDYTDEDSSYDFDPQEWAEYGFVQLRHWPLISVERAVWLSPVKGEIMDMVANDWLRLHKQFGQIRMFPKGGFTYGPYSVYGPLWTGMGAKRYPGAFEFDYSTGYKSSDFVPEGLRAVIGKYATIKALSVIGDGILAGFSSQSISLDGLSESFSSTQSATSIKGDSQVYGYGKIEDMYTSEKWRGKTVLSMNRQNKELELKEIKDVLRHYCGNKKAYIVTMDSGNSLEITEDHSLFTDKMEEVKGSDIRIGMFLMCKSGAVKVHSVKETKVDWMYDLSVIDNENFVANDFVVHNSAYFGARIKSYVDSINEWLKKNRYKFSPIPISFVGAV